MLDIIRPYAVDSMEGRAQKCWDCLFLVRFDTRFCVAAYKAIERAWFQIRAVATPSPVVGVNVYVRW